MSMHVVNGAQLQCSFGAAPSNLVVLPTNREKIANQFAANIMDHVPMVNIIPFGMCSSLANPTTASATSAAMGALTPTPCIPVVPAPWAPGSPTVLVANQPALNNPAKCMCAYAGVISIALPARRQRRRPDGLATGTQFGSMSVCASSTVRSTLLVPSRAISTVSRHRLSSDSTNTETRQPGPSASTWGGVMRVA
jgi:hypothetical protein